jgi:DNA ligase-1
MLMDNPWKIVAELEANPSRLVKESIIKIAAEQKNNDFFQGCRLALDPMITFGLKQIPEKTDADGPGLSWDNFSLIVTGFVNRKLTGNAARDTVHKMMASATQEQWNGWFRRILIKDLRCSMSEKTVNKMVGEEYAIPVFGCQLAHDSSNHESKVSGRKLIEVKLDGVRVITIVYPDGRVDQFSRNGKELVNFEHVKEQLSQVAHGFNEPMVLDGEIMSSSFQDLMKQVHRKDNVAAGDAVLNLFDYLTLAEFEAGGAGSARQEHRSAMLTEWYATVQDQLPNISVVGQELVDLDTDAGQSRYKEINAQAIEGGYEGIMLKDPAARYECKRSVAWLKLKPFIEVSLAVVDFEEGTGRNVGKLGALVCEGDDDGRRIRVNVGSGFSDLNRDEFWLGRGKIMGHVAEVRADAVTQNQDGTFSLRFPRFLRFRGFTPAEKM